MTIQPACEYADSTYCCVFVFFHFGRMPLSFLVKFVAGFATKCHVKENGREKAVRKGGGDTNTVRTMNNTQLQSILSPQQHVHERHHHQHFQSDDPRLTSRLLKLQSDSGNCLLIFLSVMLWHGSRHRADFAATREKLWW